MTGKRGPDGRFLPGENIVDITGQKFGRLTVLEFDHIGTKWPLAYWKCRCDCGTICVKEGRGLRNGDIQSCGCLARENVIQRVTKFNYSKDYKRLYRIFVAMYHRCYDPNEIGYSRYGGRGIRICKDWYNGENLDNVGNFIKWALANGYRDPLPNEPRTEWLTIDRIDSNGPYAPWNCRWIPSKYQSSNTRNNRFINDGTGWMTYTQFEIKYGLKCGFVRDRTKSNWNVDEIIHAAKHPELGMHKHCKTQVHMDKDGFRHVFRRIPGADVGKHKDEIKKDGEG